MNYSFLDKIKVSEKLIRKTNIVTDIYGFNTTFREWEINKIKEREVYIIGSRTLKNGIIFREDGINFFEEKESFAAYLVVENINRKPFLVLNNSIKK